MNYMMLFILFLIGILLINKNRIKQFKSTKKHEMNVELNDIMDELKHYKYVNPVLFEHVEKLIPIFFQSRGFKKCKHLYDDIVNILNELHLDMDNDLEKDVKFLYIIKRLETYMKSKVLLLAKKRGRFYHFTEDVLAQNTYDLLI